MRLTLFVTKKGRKREGLVVNQKGKKRLETLYIDSYKLGMLREQRFAQKQISNININSMSIMSELLIAFHSQTHLESIQYNICTVA
jgi:hypothetical protein